MKTLIAYILMSIIVLNSYSQAKQKSANACDKLKRKGYTQQFCDYNDKYAFKSIPFESSLDFVSSKLHMTKGYGDDNQYNCDDGDIINWATVKFDNCIFDFSSNNKLDGVQLLLLNHDDGTDADVKQKLQRVKDYLTFYFGKPEMLIGSEENLIWNGNKIYILVPSSTNLSSASIAIYRNNIKPIDNL